MLTLSLCLLLPLFSDRQEESSSRRRECGRGSSGSWHQVCFHAGWRTHLSYPGGMWETGDPDRGHPSWSHCCVCCWCSGQTLRWTIQNSNPAISIISLASWKCDAVTMPLSKGIKYNVIVVNSYVIKTFTHFFGKSFYKLLVTVGWFYSPLQYCVVFCVYFRSVILMQGVGIFMGVIV